MNKVKIEKIRFIKLGTNNDAKEEYCLEHGKLVIGYKEINHLDTFENIKKECMEKYGSDLGAASRHAKQIQNFYDSSETTLWITFAKKKVWWGVIDPKKEPSRDQDGFTYRDLALGWNSDAIDGTQLTFENVSGALLKTQGFRGTICDITNSNNDSFDIEEYTKRLINGDALEEVKNAENNKITLTKSMSDLIKLLHPKDFEYIIDLIFQYSGWKKLTPGAGVEKFIDLDLLMPLTNERAVVQIKSSTTQSQYQEYENIFYEHDIYDRFFYVFHTSEDTIKVLKDDKPIHILSIDKVAELIVELGLISILIKKVS